MTIIEKVYCFALQWFSSILEDKNQIFSSNSLKAEFLVFTASLFDSIWFTRNKCSLGAKIPSVHVLEKLVARKAHEHWSSISRSEQISGPLFQKWTPPTDGWLKLNVDATFDEGSAFSALVLRNHNGSILKAASFNHLCLEPVVAESLALFDACHFLMDLNMENVIIESDCLNAITFINCNSLSCFWTISPIMEKIKTGWKDWPGWTFRYVSRTANYSAHSLAKWAKICNFVGIVPLNSILSFVFCDLGHPLVDYL
ncbi:hypothetical protein CASFOL_024075 [Castilleja foliolosa]|uniref:RNase H type-1 domain-containing protein n=1 Tax=Castilleja foliolosa TaxID=1961234 RepID=A0ABD3CQA7_9LAMI